MQTRGSWYESRLVQTIIVRNPPRASNRSYAIGEGYQSPIIAHVSLLKLVPMKHDSIADVSCERESKLSGIALCSCSNYYINVHLT